MKKLFLAALMLLTCCLSTLQAQTPDVVYGTNPGETADDEDFDSKSTWYLVKIDGKYLMKDAYGIMALAAVDEEVMPEINPYFHWMFYKDDNGIFIYNRKNGYLGYMIPQGVRQFWVSDGTKAYAKVCTPLSIHPKYGISMQNNNKTFYLTFGDKNYMEWSSKGKKVSLEIVDLKTYQKECEDRWNAKKVKALQIAARKSSSPLTTDAIQAKKDRDARLQKLFNPNPQKALQKVHEALARAQQEYGNLLKKGTGAATIQFRYNSTSGQAHFPLNDFADNLGYGVPIPGHPNKPTYDYHVTVTPTSITFKLIDKDIMLNSGSDSQGNATTPKDPFTQTWGCKSGTHTVTGATFALPDYHIVKINGTSTCSHSHRAISRSGSTSLLSTGQKVYTAQGIKEKAGTTDYYPDHCFSHTETVTFSIANLAKGCEMTSAQVINLMLQGGAILMGTTDNKNGTFISNQCMRDCLVWALWNANGFTDQKFLNTYVWAEEKTVGILKQCEDVKDKFKRYDHMPADNETELATQMNEDLKKAQELVQTMLDNHVDSYSYTHDMCNILLKLGLWDWGRIFGVKSIQDIYGIFEGNGASTLRDFPDYARNIACRDYARVCKCEILALANGGNRGDNATKYYQTYGNPSNLDHWNSIANCYDEPSNDAKIYFDCQPCDNFALYEFFINRSPKRAAQYVKEIMNQDSPDQLDTYPSYRIMHEMYPELLQ